jgi:hypothetical protein
MSRRSAIWAAVGLSLGWLGLIGLVALFMPPLAAPVPWITRLFQALAVLLPIGLVGMVVWLLRELAALRAEAKALRTTLDALRRPAPPPRPDAPAAATLRPRGASLGDAAADRAEPAAAGQGALDLPPPPQAEPLPMVTLIAALSFPRDETDRDGFRALERALNDPATGRVIRAAEDVLTLLAQDGVYAEDLEMAEAPPISGVVSRWANAVARSPGWPGWTISIWWSGPPDGCARTRFFAMPAIISCASSTRCSKRSRRAPMTR